MIKNVCQYSKMLTLVDLEALKYIALPCLFHSIA